MSHGFETLPKACERGHTVQCAMRITAFSNRKAVFVLNPQTVNLLKGLFWCLAHKLYSRKMLAAFCDGWS